MIFSDIAPVGIVIFISGVITIVALLLSKISTLLPNKRQQEPSGGYECGFQNNRSDFLYYSENNGLISLFLVIELSVAWLLLCCVFDVLDPSWSGIIFVRILSIIIMISVIMSYKAVFKVR